MAHCQQHIIINTEKYIHENTEGTIYQWLGKAHLHLSKHGLSYGQCPFQFAQKWKRIKNGPFENSLSQTLIYD